MNINKKQDLITDNVTHSRIFFGKIGLVLQILGNKEKRKNLGKFRSGFNLHGPQYYSQKSKFLMMEVEPKNILTCTILQIYSWRFWYIIQTEFFFFFSKDHCTKDARTVFGLFNPTLLGACISLALFMRCRTLKHCQRRVCECV